MRSIDFVMAYTQADVKTDIFMQLPSGTTIQGVDPNKHLLKLQKNLYGLKDGQVTWHEHIKTGLLSQGFHQSKVDPCLFIKGTFLLVLYVNDAALFSPHSMAINCEIISVKQSFDSPMKATSKITWGPDCLSTQMAVLSSNKRRQLTIVWSCLAWALHPKMSKPMILWPNRQRFFMMTKMGQTGSMHGTTGQSLAASTTCRQ